MTTAITKSVSSTLPAHRNGKGGRPHKITFKLRSRIVELISRGLTFKDTCAAVKISPQTLLSYRETHPDFQEEIDFAVSCAIERRLKIIEKAADLGDVNSAKWLLEHLHPSAYARNRIELSGTDGSPLAATVAVYLPQKDDHPNNKPLGTVDGVCIEEGEDGR